MAAHIRQLIFDGSLQHGDRIRQDEVAETLGVSRIPVREAIIALDREGWVTIEPHRGAFVQGIDEASVRDHYELIGLMWGLAAKRAVERGDAEALTVLVGLQRDLAGTDDVDEFAKRNEAFVRQLFEMAHSARLVSQLRVMPGIVPGNFFAQVPEAVATQTRGTASIVKAVKTGDGEKAADAALKLLMRQGDHVVDALAARAVAAAS